MISLNYRDSRPIYEQITDSLKKLIISGAISAGDKLPSVRSLAVELSINPNTIQRAYNELETQGYICCIPGKGNFVADGREGQTGESSISKLSDEHIRRLSGELTEKLRELKFLGFDKEKVTELVNQIFDKEENK